MFRFRSVLLSALLLALLIPASADAQRVCFSFASEDNVDGPNFDGVPGNLLTDGAALNPDGRVQVRLLIQPFCDGGPVFVRNLYLTVQTHHTMYMVNAFGPNWVHNWNREGSVIFTNPSTGAVFLQFDSWKLLMTSWSPFNGRMGQTATLQANDGADPMIMTTSSPELDNILLSAGFSPNLLHTGQQFAFTITNIRKVGAGGSPFNPALDPVTGDWFSQWEADGSFSAATGT